MFGYRVGLIVGDAGVLYNADGIGWANAYYAMGALMLVPAATTLLAREPPRSRPRATPPRPSTRRRWKRSSRR